MAVQALCVRETVKVGLTARPALAEERASSSRPSWARAAAKLRVCDQIISADFDRSSKPRDCAVITCREASSHSLQNSSMYGHWYRSGRGARPTICLFGATDENFAKSDKGMGAVARFRSSSSARSHSAMPCGARLVNISHTPTACGRRRGLERKTGVRPTSLRPPPRPLWDRAQTNLRPRSRPGGRSNHRLYVVGVDGYSARQPAQRLPREPLELPPCGWARF